jgi:hypothetical protein
VPELIGARPPAAPVAGVAARGAEEGKGSTRVPVPGSLRLGRQRSDGGLTMKAAAGRAPVRVTRGSKMGQGGAVGGGDAGCLFIGSEGERGGRASKGNGRRWWCAIMVVEQSFHEGIDRGGG